MVEVRKPKMVIPSMFKLQDQQSHTEGRMNISKAASSITKLSPITNQSNQCWSIAVFQMLMGMTELWEGLFMYGDNHGLSVTQFIEQKPFTMAGIVMGGILKEESSNTQPKESSFDVIKFCRLKFLEKSYGSAKQEDASEFFGHFIEKLIVENPGGLIGRNLNADYCKKLTCQDCHNVVEKNEINTYYNLSVQEEDIMKKELNLQNLVSNEFDRNHLVHDYKCEKCQSRTVIHNEEVKLSHNTPTDLVLVVKKYQYFKDKGPEKASVGIICVDKIDVPFWGNLNSEESTETYQLRSVVCHLGKTYSQGHYRTAIIERDGNITTYHELNDAKHNILTKKRFYEDIKNDGYIYHFGKRVSGNLTTNHYKSHIGNKNSLKTFRASCLRAWRPTQKARATKQKRESVQHDFTLRKPIGNKKVRSTDYPIVQFFNDKRV